MPGSEESNMPNPRELGVKTEQTANAEPRPSFWSEPQSRRGFLGRAAATVVGAAAALYGPRIEFPQQTPKPEEKGDIVEIPVGNQVLRYTKAELAASQYPSQFGISMEQLSKNLGLLSTMRVEFGPKRIMAAGGVETSTGRFYWETNGRNGDQSKGYFITGDMWNHFQRVGGDGVWGPIMTQEYNQGGTKFQWSQRARFEIKDGQLFFGNTFDDLTAAGKDEWLEQTKQTPKSFNWASDAGKPWDKVVEGHMALLSDYPPLKSAYESSGGLAIAMHGLPMAIKEYDDHVTVRCQRSAIQLWKKDVPWARKGETTVALGGEISKEAGLIPTQALVLTDLGRGGPVTVGPTPEVPRVNLPPLPEGLRATENVPWGIKINENGSRRTENITGAFREAKEENGVLSIWISTDQANPQTSQRFDINVSNDKVFRFIAARVPESVLWYKATNNTEALAAINASSKNGDRILFSRVLSGPPLPPNSIAPFPSNFSLNFWR